MSDDPVSPMTVHMAGRASGSSACRYEPYTTMNVPPNDSAKIACPIAAAITFAERSWKRNSSRYHRTPGHALGSVSVRTMTTMVTTVIAGKTIMLTTSMPFRTPFTSTAAQARITTAVQQSWSRNDRSTKPWSGGRIAAASNRMRPSIATWPTVYQSTQPITAE